MASMILYGLPLSQACRAVIWALVQKRKTFHLEPVAPGSSGEGGSRHPDFLAKNTGGTIPVIEEPESGFVLGESCAILCYLARTNGWHDLYPEDPQAAARVDWYQHYHHESVRQASIGYIAPAFRPDIQFPEGTVQGAKAAVEYALSALDKGFLARSRFIAAEHATIADFSAYADLGQLRAEFTNLYDFGKYPNVKRWLDDMLKVDAHDDVHVALYELGDISSEPPSMEKLGEVNMLGIQHLAKSGFID